VCRVVHSSGETQTENPRLGTVLIPRGIDFPCRARCLVAVDKVNSNSFGSGAGASGVENIRYTDIAAFRS